MKKILSTFGIILAVAAALVPGAHAQAAIARILYEEAELAFGRSDLATTIRKLDEAERTFGDANAPILRLRIMAREQMVRGDANYAFSVLDALREDCRTYDARLAGSDDWIDYTREVRPLCQGLSTYPATRAAYDTARRAAAGQPLAVAERQPRGHATREAAAPQTSYELQIQTYERRAGRGRMIGWSLLAAGAGLAGVSSLEGGDFDGPLYSAGAILAGAGAGTLYRASRHAGKAADLRRASALGFAPVYSPQENAFGVAATVRF